MGLAAGAQYAGEFFAGWLTEYSLSIDNLFVFVIIMSRFAGHGSISRPSYSWGSFSR